MPAEELKLRKEAFLKAYGKLCKEHGFSLSGCGCCGSPYLVTHCKKDNDVKLTYDEKYEHVWFDFE